LLPTNSNKTELDFQLKKKQKVPEKVDENKEEELNSQEERDEDDQFHQEPKKMKKVRKRH